MRVYKVVVLGYGGVGKSALAVKFVCGMFVEKYDPTIEDFYRKEFDVDGSPVIIEILDTAGKEQFASMNDLYIKNGQGFILVYSITNAATFIDLRGIKDHIRELKGSAVSPIILVGNKCDMEEERVVPTQDGERQAREWGVQFLETSAKTNFNVHETFAEMVQLLRERNTKGSSNCCTVL